MGIDINVARFAIRLVIASIVVLLILGPRSGPLTEAAGTGEEMRFRLFELDDLGARTLMDEGIRRYPISDIFGSSGLLWLLEKMDNTHYSRAVMVTREFSIGGSIYPEAVISGFGLWLHRHPAWYQVWMSRGFSWEWFDREDGFVFRHRQGAGRVQVTFAAAGDKLELGRIVFLEDVTFRLAVMFPFFSRDRETHHMHVRAGSVLNLAR